MSNLHRSFYTWGWLVDCEYLLKNCDISGGLGEIWAPPTLVRNGLSMTLSILAAALCCHRRKHHRHNLQVVLLCGFLICILALLGLRTPSVLNMIINIIRVRIPEWIQHHTTPHDQLEARCGEISTFLFLHHHLLGRFKKTHLFRAKS